MYPDKEIRITLVNIKIIDNIFFILISIQKNYEMIL